MTDISVIILTGKEEIHIGRCLEKLAPLEPKQVFVVESQKGDRTHETAIEVAKQLQWQVEGERRLRPEVEVERREGTATTLHLVWHDWPGNQADQFNWALDNLKIETSWILRLDADEYLLPGLNDEIKAKIPQLPDDVGGVVLKRRHYFAGGWAKHGTYPVSILRLFRTGRGRYAPGQVMDERIEISGKEIEFDGDFVDYSLVSMDDWREKHRGYAKREAQQAIESIRTGTWVDPRKAAYYKLPRYLRAFAYFGIRYFLLGGFLDGYAGWMWNFWQGLWYRCLVDYEIGKLKKAVPAGC